MKWLLWVVAVLIGCSDGAMQMPDPPCMGAACTCSGALCNGLCVNLSVDSANCGACGRSCGYAACVDNQCMAEPLTQAAGLPGDLVASNEIVAFATSGEASSDGALYRVASTGAPTVIYRGLGAEPALSLSGGAIVVADSGLAGECRVQASAGGIFSVDGERTTLLARGRHCARGVAAFTGGLTWFEAMPLSPRSTDDPAPTLSHLPSTAAAPTALYTDSHIDARTAAVSGNAMIWRELRADGTSLVRMPLTGGARQVLVTGDIGAYAADDHELVYTIATDLGRVAIVRTLANGKEVTAGPVEDSVTALAFDAGFIYTLSGGDAWALDRKTHKRARLSADRRALRLAQDDDFVYTLLPSQRTLHRTELSRIRKPVQIRVDGLDDPAQLHGNNQCDRPYAACPLSFPDHPLGTMGCFDLSRDPEHCGDCFTTCNPTETCTQGSCTCAAPSAMCGDACVDLATDGENCGACGHSCDGGGCRGGVCTPATTNQPARSAVQDAAAVYLAAGAQVRRIAKQDLAITILAQLSSARELTTDGDRLFAIETSGTTGSIHSVRKAGGNVQLYRDRPDPRHIAAGAGSVVWVEGTPPTLIHAAADGSAVRAALQPAGLYDGADDDESRAVVMDGPLVYWLLGDAVAQRGAILRLDTSAATPTLTLVATLDRDPAAMALAAGHVFITTRGTDGVLWSLPITGGTPTVLASGLFHASTVAVGADGTLYWADGSLGHDIVHELPPGHVLPRMVQQANGPPSAILPDGDRLYVAAGALQRLTR